MKKQIALITGAGRGIGKQVSLLLAKQKIHVIIVARTLSALEELYDEIIKLNGSCTIAQMDISDAKGVSELSNNIRARWKKLDILISSAGYLHNLTPLSHLNENELIKSFNINFFAPWMLIKNFEDLLIKSGNGRVVFLCPNSKKILKQFWGGYSTSNSALETLIKTWDLEIKHTNIKANIFVPKPTLTNLRKIAYPGENIENLLSPKRVAKEIIKMCSKDFNHSGKIIKM